MQLLIQHRNEDKAEWVIIEMQVREYHSCPLFVQLAINIALRKGDLESRVGDAAVEGKFVGDLHYAKDSGAPVLIIGHHILHGKVQEMERPFVAMEKAFDSDSEITEFRVKAVVRKKLVFKTRPKPIIANVPKKI